MAASRRFATTQSVARSAALSTFNTLQVKKSLQDVKPDIDRAVQYLQSCEDFSTKQAHNRFTYLMGIAGFGFITCDLKEVGTYLVQIGYATLFPKMWNVLQDFTVKERWKSQGCKNLIDMLYGYMCVANHSVDFGDELVKAGAISLLFSALEKLDHTDRRAYELINPILGNLQNIIRTNNSHRAYYRKAQAITILERFTESLNMELKTDSLLILAYVVAEDENKQLGNKGVIRFLVDLLKAAVNTRGHQACLSSGAYSAKEILDGLNHLAVNDDNKIAIDKAVGIPVIARMLQKDFSVEEQQLAAEALWNLAFIESIRQNLIKRGIDQVLEKLQSSPNPDLRQACVSALWQIKVGGTPSTNKTKEPSKNRECVSQGVEHQSKSTPKSPRIMISYQWDQQQHVLQIRDMLTTAGYDVWMDVTNMKGDILHAMAQGVEDSVAILMCMTEKYKESRACRSEASYAYKLGKPIVPLLLEPGYKPDGWLGILQGMDLYYEVHSNELLETNIRRLFKAIDDCIGRKRNIEETGVTIPKEDQTDVARPSDHNESSPSADIEQPTESPSDNDQCTTPSTKTVPPSTFQTPSGLSKESTTANASPAASNSIVSGWSTDDVQEWLNKINLPELCSTLDFCDGDHLEMLYTQFCNNSKEFKEEMKSDFEMSSKAYLQFTVALKKLFKQ